LVRGRTLNCFAWPQVRWFSPGKNHTLVRGDNFFVCCKESHVRDRSFGVGFVNPLLDLHIFRVGANPGMVSAVKCGNTNAALGHCGRRIKLYVKSTSTHKYASSNESRRYLRIPNKPTADTTKDWKPPRIQRPPRKPEIKKHTRHPTDTLRIRAAAALFTEGGPASATISNGSTRE
jgi:hypothetical protein